MIADVHLGYEWARGRGGDCVPAHSLAETLGKLSPAARTRFSIERLVVAGDLVESRRPCLRTSRDVSALTRWLTGRGVAFHPLAGNHDPPRRVPPLPERLEVAGWTIAHGHRPLNDRAARFSRATDHPFAPAAGLEPGVGGRPCARSRAAFPRQADVVDRSLAAAFIRPERGVWGGGRGGGGGGPPGGGPAGGAAGSRRSETFARRSRLRHDSCSARSPG